MRDEHLVDGISSLLLDQSASPIALTGTTAETLLRAVRVPGGLLGQQGMLTITSLWSLTNNANAKTPRLYYGGTAFRGVSFPSSASALDRTHIWARGEQAQISFPATTGVVYGFGTSLSPTVGAVDSRVDQTLEFRAQLANAGDVITLEAYSIVVYGCALR